MSSRLEKGGIAVIVTAAVLAVVGIWWWAIAGWPYAIGIAWYFTSSVLAASGIIMQQVGYERRRRAAHR